jgi:hypothetical protein
MENSGECKDLEDFDEEDKEDNSDVRTEAGDELSYPETLAMTIADQEVIHSISLIPTTFYDKPQAVACTVICFLPSVL